MVSKVYDSLGASKFGEAVLFMKAMEVNQSKQGPALIAANVPQPQPVDGELLIRVRAAGVTPTELFWYPTTHTKNGAPRTGAVPGHEFFGLRRGDRLRR